MSRHKLKYCNSAEIDAIVKRIKYYSLIYSKEYIEYLINISVDTKAFNVVELYNINDCIDIIIANGDIYDAMQKMNDELNMEDKIVFHQQLAKPYVKELILQKVNEKLYR